MPGHDGLVMRGITKVFPGVRALDGVDLDVRFGAAVALVGENGAGKSTLMKVLSGSYPPDGGTMTLNSGPYEPAGPAEAAAAGVVLIHQELSLLPNLSLAENIFVGRIPLRRGFLDRRALNQQAAQLLQRVGVHLDPRTMTSACSVAVQQQVEIAKALAQSPRIIVFDEPTASLGQDEVEILFGIVDSLKRDGVGIVWITHRLEEVPRVGDEIVVLRDGQRVAAWDRADVPTPELVQAMVGRAVGDIYPEPAAPRDDVLLKVTNLTRPGEFEDVSFELHSGEILGIAGLVGAGRSELVGAICGAAVPSRGEVVLRGQPLRARTPGDAVRAGVVLVPEDRKLQGLAQRLTMADNIALPRRGLLKGIVRNRDLTAAVADAARRVDMRGHLSQLAQTLSGGNQQKGVIAKWLMLSPDVIVFDEPTRGIDVGAKAAIYEIIHDLAARGAGVIVVSSELPEVLGVSHRIMVLSRGRVTGVLPRAEATQESVMALAVA